MFRIYPGGSTPVGGIAPRARKSDAPGGAPAGQRYDQVEFSSQLGETEKRVRETVSRLSREIRSRDTTQEVERLQQQVASGEYQPSARDIAARMLLLREEG